QKRLRAKGRSFETVTITASGTLAASWLKRRTEVAQTEVSTLGKMLRTTCLPARSFEESGLRSVLTRWNSGAGAPGRGRSPTVRMGFPLKVIVAMGRR